MKVCKENEKKLPGIVWRSESHSNCQKASERPKKTRLFFVGLFIVLTGCAFFIIQTWLQKNGKTEKILNIESFIKLSELPTVSTSINISHRGFSNRIPYDMLMLGANSYVMDIAGSPLKADEKLMLERLEFILENSSRERRVQLFIKEDILFKDLWRFIEMCSERNVSSLSIAARQIEPSSNKKLFQDIMDYCNPPAERFRFKSITAPRNIKVDTNLVIVGYGVNHLSVNHKDCLLADLRDMIPLRENHPIALLVSVECSIQEVIKMMEELNKRFLDEAYLGILPEQSIVNPGSIIRVSGTGSW